ncbi:hypothetical protein [Pantoea sp. BAV 3049]|uniref:hypothetical protein n=1 Tax=Pantoea sp. BAV 3049 TaxID=2654188 RepID=UPI00131D6527|nr:hypothetical protein [Pantoea sp. BAV 3049]
MNVIPLKPESKDLKKKLKALNKIAFSVDAAERRLPSPRAMLAALEATGWLVIYSLAIFAIRHSVSSTTQMNFGVAIVAWFILVWCIAFVVAYPLQFVGRRTGYTPIPLRTS